MARRGGGGSKSGSSTYVPIIYTPRDTKDYTIGSASATQKNWQFTLGIKFFLFSPFSSDILFLFFFYLPLSVPLFNSPKPKNMQKPK